MKSRDFSSALWILNKNTSSPDEGVQGTARFTGKRLELTIPIGCLLEKPPVNGVITYGTDPIEAPEAFGLCQTGERITLTELSTPGPGFSSPGTKRENLTATSALVCKTDFISPNPNVQSLTLQVSGLWNWTGADFNNITSTFENNEWISTSGTWCINDFEKLPLFKNENVDISLQPVLIEKGGHIPLQEFSIRSDVYLHIELADHTTPLNTAMNRWVYPVWQMLTFCMGFRCSIDEIEIKTEDGLNALYYLPLIIGEEKPSEAQLDHMPLPYSFVSQLHTNFLESWLHLDGDAKRAALTLIGIHNNSKINWLNPMFTTVSGAFEAISHVGEKTQDIANNRLQRIKAQIEKCFEDDEDIRWILQKVNNNIPPANYYANSLVKKLGPFADYIIPDKSRFLKDLRRSRNAYVHQTSALDKSNILSDEELYSLAMATKVLCYGAVMLHLGIEPETILERFQTSLFCQTEIHHYARKMYSIHQNEFD